MKRKKYYYNHPFPIDTMKNWLKYKDYHYVTWKGHFTIKELYDIELQPKHRHRRSIAPRALMRLCGYTCYREEAHRHRLFVYQEGAK